MNKIIERTMERQVGMPISVVCCILKYGSNLTHVYKFLKQSVPSEQLAKTNGCGHNYRNRAFIMLGIKQYVKRN